VSRPNTPAKLHADFSWEVEDASLVFLTRVKITQKTEKGTAAKLLLFAGTVADAEKILLEKGTTLFSEDCRKREDKILNP